LTHSFVACPFLVNRSTVESPKLRVFNLLLVRLVCRLAVIKNVGKLNIQQSLSGLCLGMSLWGRVEVFE
jgi:hypothetical protein